jgi:serine/threonine-protein kinase RsbW
MMEIYIPSELGYEKIAICAAAAVAQRHGLKAERVDDLKTAVAEAVTNAIEHGNQLQAELRVWVGLKLREAALVIDVVDQGCRPIPALPQEYQDRPNHRGWGMVLMKNLMDEVEVMAAPDRNQVRLVAYLEG